MFIRQRAAIQLILEVTDNVVYTDLICMLVKIDVAWCLFYSASLKGHSLYSVHWIYNVHDNKVKLFRRITILDTGTPLGACNLDLHIWHGHCEKILE